MKPIQITDLNKGGLSDSDFMGRPGSVAEIVGIDLHSEPGLVKVQQKLTKITAANSPTEFCKNYVICSNGRNYWFSAESGNIWEDNSGTDRKSVV